MKHLKNNKGLTLIELMIVIAISSIVITVLFSSIFFMYVGVLSESMRSKLRSDGQILLLNLQEETLFAISYGEELDADLSDAYEPSGGWAHDSDPQTLIINEIALDSRRNDDDRNIVRRALNACETSPITSNPVAINNVVYFVQDNPGKKYDTLYKRTITPTYDLCSLDRDTGNPCIPQTATCFGNARETSCPVSEIGNNNCTIEDKVLSEEVIDMEIQYYAKNNVPTAFPSSADKVEITLLLGDTVYGREVEAEIKHTIRKIN